MDDAIIVELRPELVMMAVFRLVWMIVTLLVWWRFCIMLERGMPLAWTQIALALCAVVTMIVVGRIVL